jgi:hypothetical protein
VQVFTDEGSSGLGECSPMHPAAIAHAVNTVLRPLILGINPMKPGLGLELDEAAFKRATEA